MVWSDCTAPSIPRRPPRAFCLSRAKSPRALAPTFSKSISTYPGGRLWRAPTEIRRLVVDTVNQILTPRWGGTFSGPPAISRPYASPFSLASFPTSPPTAPAAEFTTTVGRFGLAEIQKANLRRPAGRPMAPSHAVGGARPGIDLAQWRTAGGGLHTA